MGQSLTDKRVAFLATDGFEQEELTRPWEFLREAGAKVELLSLRTGRIRGFHHADKGDEFEVDRDLDQAISEDYDALVLPGGVANPDSLRLDDRVASLIADFDAEGKLIAAICHGPWPLIEAGIVSGRTMTSWPSLRSDLENADARWVDEEVQVDGNLVTSRKPDDLPAFCAAIQEKLESQAA